MDHRVSFEVTFSPQEAKHSLNNSSRIFSNPTTTAAARVLLHTPLNEARSTKSLLPQLGSKQALIYALQRHHDNHAIPSIKGRYPPDRRVNGKMSNPSRAGCR